MATASLLVVSGFRNPETDLTDEQCSEIRSKVSQLSVPTVVPHSKLDRRAFAIDLGQDLAIIVADDVVSVFHHEQEPSFFRDTVGITSYLQSILHDLIEKW